MRSRCADSPRLASGVEKERRCRLQTRLPAQNATTADDLAAVLAGMDAAKQAIALQFGQALAQTTDPDTLARGRRVALNFADTVARCRRDMALRHDDDSH